MRAKKNGGDEGILTPVRRQPNPLIIKLFYNSPKTAVI